MNGAEILTTIAQLGVAVTGFSGIVIVFNRPPGRLSEFEAFRISILFANSLAAVFLALIPFVLFYSGLPDTVIWRTASALCFVFEVIFVASHVGPARKFLREHRALFNVGLLGFVTCGHAMNAILQLCNALDVINRRNLSIFILGLLWLLFHSAFQFGRILFVQPMTDAAASRRWQSDP
jgi:hypothetical protein